MMILNSTFRNTAKTGAFLLMLALPASALAAVHITEVMYDAPGSDQGAEWVEVANDASGPVNLVGWRFAEGGSNHVLTVVQGTTTLVASAVAVISNNPQTFLASYPAYTGTLFKSSFSLTNVGETIAIKNKSLGIVDTVTYSSDMGAAGDGNSLHVMHGTVVASAPNPGSLALTEVVVATPKGVATPLVFKKPIKNTAVPNNKKLTLSNSPPSTAQPAPVESYDPAPTGIPSGFVWTLGLLALLVLGAAAAWYVRPTPKLATVTEGDAHEFELE